MGFHSHHSHDHGHDHGHSHEHDGKEIPRVLSKAVLITVVFMVIELVAGYWANSLALISDGMHMLTDVGAITLSIFAYWITRRPSNPSMSFGYHRAEILGALASGLAIWLISGVLVFEAVGRLKDPPAVEGPIVFVVAAIGLVANLASMKILHGSTHGSMNVRAAYLHLLTDALGSVAAVIAGAVLWLTDWRPIDPIVTILFAILMLFSSWRLVKEAVGVLMEGTPPGIDLVEVQKELAAIAGVQEVHDLHIWTVATGRLALSVHLISREGEEALSMAHGVLSAKYGIVHTTIQVEHPEKFRSDRCYDCGTH